MKIEKKLSELINSEMGKTNSLTDERERLFIDVLAMVQTLNKDGKIKDLAYSMQLNFPEYGTLI